MRFGSPIRGGGIANWAITGLILVLAVVVLAFLMTARYARKETVTGSLVAEAGAQQLTAPRSGVIQEVMVEEGETVSAGDPILTVSYDTTSASGQSISSLLGASTEAQADAISIQGRARASALDSQIQELRARRAGLIDERSRLVQDRPLQEERIVLAEETVRATRQIYDRQLIAAPQMRQREEALLAARQQLGSIDLQIGRSSAEVSQIDAQIRRLTAEKVDTAAASQEAAARLNERQAGVLGQQGQLMAARFSGRVAALTARPGKSVQPGDPLAVVLPDGVGLEAELWVPSRAAGFLSEGDRVRIMFDAFPYQRFGMGSGRVIQISRSPTLPDDLPTPIETKEPLYRVRVRLDSQSVHAYGKSWSLTPGSRLNADLILDDRSLITWLLDPILAARARQ